MVRCAQVSCVITLCHNAYYILVLKDSGNSSILSLSSEAVGDSIKIKEWEFGRLQDELAATQGIRIRRRPPTGPPLHYEGPFELEENEDNAPRNILEDIIWTKDNEVSQALSNPISENISNRLFF